MYLLLYHVFIKWKTFKDLLHCRVFLMLVFVLKRVTYFFFICWNYIKGLNFSTKNILINFAQNILMLFTLKMSFFSTWTFWSTKYIIFTIRNIVYAFTWILQRILKPCFWIYSNALEDLILSLFMVAVRSSFDWRCQ